MPLKYIRYTTCLNRETIESIRRLIGSHHETIIVDRAAIEPDQRTMGFNRRMIGFNQHVITFTRLVIEFTLGKTHGSETKPGSDLNIQTDVEELRSR